MEITLTLHVALVLQHSRAALLVTQPAPRVVGQDMAELNELYGRSSTSLYKIFMSKKREVLKNE